MSRENEAGRPGARNTTRRSALRSTVRWNGIIAQSESVVIEGNQAVITIAAAVSIDHHPTGHDKLNARLCTLVFSKQPRFRSLKAFRVLIRDEKGTTKEVAFDAESLNRHLSSAWNENKRISRPIPAPLLAYLIQNNLKKSILICCKSNASP